MWNVGHSLLWHLPACCSLIAALLHDHIWHFASSAGQSIDLWTLQGHPRQHWFILYHFFSLLFWRTLVRMVHFMSLFRKWTGLCYNGDDFRPFHGSSRSSRLFGRNDWSIILVAQLNNTTKFGLSNFNETNFKSILQLIIHNALLVCYAYVLFLVDSLWSLFLLFNVA